MGCFTYPCICRPRRIVSLSSPATLTASHEIYASNIRPSTIANDSNRTKSSYNYSTTTSHCTDHATDTHLTVSPCFRLFFLRAAHMRLLCTFDLCASSFHNPRPPIFRVEALIMGTSLVIYFGFFVHPSHPSLIASSFLVFVTVLHCHDH
ncbi:hypothetical protein BS47DRAFT_858174 [Hydnum rufescens UP504]|uniref:Uncharacterized protein n=1 Tax=Hydnum rufescens UP504 TaxID=1448309 RepID=A0A9P6AZ66_9AGAM|nr:hypothetical protein BS47DRAFT_858174 [Hydnum rufescens UP504]